MLVNSFPCFDIMLTGLIFVYGSPYCVSFSSGSEGKESACSAGRPGFDPWVGKIPWRRKWQSTPVLLSGKSHGQRSLVGYSPWGRKESDTTERLHIHVPDDTNQILQIRWVSDIKFLANNYYVYKTILKL